MFADNALLTAWQSDVPVDGHGDVVFWGADAEAAAAALGAPSLEHADGSAQFGWLDQPIEVLERRVDHLQRWKHEHKARFAVDPRPHDHHYAVLSQARHSPTGSGTIDLAGSRATGFFATWGDGAFPVFRDADAAGNLCRIRIELGCPAIVTRTRRFEELWFGELSRGAIASARVVRDGAPVRWMYREAPDREDDSGWRVFAGDESDEYLNDPSNAVVVSLRELIGVNPDLERLFREAGPAAFERDATGAFRRVAPPKPGA